MQNQSLSHSLGEGHPSLTTVDLAGNLPNPPHPSASTTTPGGAPNAGPTKTGARNDSVLEELRNYIVLMDQYSLHNFLIYEGKTLKETPEFQSFQRTYQYKWGAISSIIYQLEEHMDKNDIKLAIINGPKVYEFAKLNLPVLKKAELSSCIANLEQIEVASGAAQNTDISKKQMVGMVIRIQSMVRTFLCKRRYFRKRKAMQSAIRIQSYARLWAEKARYRLKLRKHYAEQDRKILEIQEQFIEYWKRQSYLQGNSSLMSQRSSVQPSPRTGGGGTGGGQTPGSVSRGGAKGTGNNTSRSRESRRSREGNDGPQPPALSNANDLMLDADPQQPPRAYSPDQDGGIAFPSNVNTTTANNEGANTVRSAISGNSPRVVPALESDQLFDTNSLLQNNANTLMPSSPKRLIILLPSISTSPFFRMEYENFAALQNTMISNLYLLADENVHLIYISPFLMTNYQISYHEKFLSLMGISTLPKRFTVITPEMVEKLPPHLTLAQQLWCSSVALNRIRHYLRTHPDYQQGNAYMICSSFTWAEKRIASYLSIPVLGPDFSIAETLNSRSYLKGLFFSTGVNYPMGAHDIFSTEELFLALTRLIAANLGVMRWNLKLNFDHNQETTMHLDVEKIPLIVDLRSEQFTLIGDKDNTASWFSRPVQLAVRKRILACLQKEFVSKVRICRRDIFSSYENLSRLIKLYGCVVESEPIEKVGYLISLVFISPTGEITLLGGAQEYCDESYQVQGYCYPQTLTPPIALNGVSTILAQKLFQEYHVMGYVNLRFISLWDDLDQQPRLWATDVKFGIMPLHGALGTATIMTNPEGMTYMPFNLIPALQEGK